MVHRLLAAGVCLTLAIIVGCSDGDGDLPAAPTATATVATATADQSAPSPTVLPTPPLTGIASIDAAVDAIQRQDSAALFAQMLMTRLACDATPTAYTPFPACDGAPHGTLVPGFPIASCEGRFSPRDAAESYVGDIVIPAFGTTAVLAVFNTGGTRFDRSFYTYAEPRYVIVLERSVGDDVLGGGLLLDDEGVVGFSRACGATPSELISFWELTDAIIPPPDER